MRSLRLNKLVVLLFWVFALVGPSMHAQDGSLDLTFNPDDLAYAPASGANSSVYVTEVAPDGKIMIGGFFFIYNGTSCKQIARLNADGTVDPSFAPPGGGVTSSSSYIRAIAFQSDGKILIGGRFTQYSSVACSHLLRLNPDGSRDTSFHIGTGANQRIDAIELSCECIEPEG